MKRIERDESMPLIEQVREIASNRVNSHVVELDFYSAALALGCSEAEAGDLDERLTARIMRSRGAI